MSKGKKTQTETEVKRPSLSSLFDRVLLLLESEIDQLPQIFQEVSPEKRLDFISKNLPLLLRYRESGEGDPEGRWIQKWGD